MSDSSGRSRGSTGRGKSGPPRRDRGKSAYGQDVHGGRGGSGAPARSGGRGGSGRRAKPELPRTRPRVPREVYQDVRGAANSGEADDVLRALGGAEDALQRGDVDAGLHFLEWAKAAASRSWAVREALGVAYYLAGRYRDAQRELLTYRRLSGREDQNHLLADCARASGDSEKVRRYVDAMLDSDVEVDRVIEGLLVLAGDRADRGDVDGALRALERAGAAPGSIPPGSVREPHLRVWYLQAQLLEERGDNRRARELREAIDGIDPEFLKALDG